MSTPTDAWLAAAPDLPPVDGPADTAQRLLLLLHYGIDWGEGWVARYRKTYWDKLLPDRVVVATYRSSTLDRWWTDTATELGSTPRNAPERAELAILLRATPAPVLALLRDETQALVLRVRIASEGVRDARRTPAHQMSA